MNRRQFARSAAAAALGAAAIQPVLSSAQSSGSNSLRFNLSVMLWTVYKDLLFEQRLEKVVEAGYHAVELVDEYKNWSPEDFRRASAQLHSLGIVVDAMNTGAACRTFNVLVAEARRVAAVLVAV